MSKNFLSSIIIFLIILFTVLFVYQKVNVPEKSSYNIVDVNANDIKQNNLLDDKQSNNMKDLSKKEIEEIIDNKILSNIKTLVPEIIQELNKNNKADTHNSVKKKEENTKNYKFDIPFIGNENAKIKIDYFYDYTCVHSKNAYNVLKKMANERKDVQVFLRPIFLQDGYRKFIAKNALAVYVADNEKFFQLHDALINFTGSPNNINIDELFSKYKIDKLEIDDLLSKDSIEKLLQTNMNLTLSLSIDGLPAYRINNKVYDIGALTYNELNKELEKY